MNRKTSWTLRDRPSRSIGPPRMGSLRTLSGWWRRTGRRTSERLSAALTWP